MNISQFWDEKWKLFDHNRRIELLQLLEDEMASIEMRDRRRVIGTNDDSLCAEYAEAQYNFSFPENIYVRRIDLGFDSALSIIHEGIHAMYNDAFSGKTSKVFTFIKIDTKKLVFERENRDIIHNHFAHLGDCFVLFNLCYIEEEITHIDSKCFLLQLIKNHINSKLITEKQSAANLLFLFYEMVFIKELNRLKYKKDTEHQFRTTYDNEIKQIDFDSQKERKEIICKPSIEICDSMIFSHYSSQLQIYKNIHNPSMIKRRNENIQKFQNSFYSFVLS